jgi:hypothetical protein
MTLSGSNVTQWRDKSGNGRHATAQSAASYSAADNALRFTSGNYYSFDSLSFAINSYFSLFIVERLQNTSSTPHVLGTDSAGNNQSLHIRYNGTPNGSTNASAFRFAFYNNDLDAQNIPAFTTADAQPIRIWSLVFTTSFRGIYLNGTLMASDANNTQLSAWNTPLLGRSYGGYYYTGFIYELLGFGGQLSTTQRQQIEGYLAAKWGLLASLPSTHPYRSLPPTLRPFGPMDVSGCSLWLDAADRTALTLSGSNVTWWNDKSGSNNHYSNVGTVAYQSNGLYFNGSSYLRNSTLAGFPFGATPALSTFIVLSAQLPSTHMGRAIFDYGNVTCSKTGYIVYVDSPASLLCTLYCGDLNVNTSITSNTSLLVSDVITYTGTPGSLTRAGWLNGSPMNVATASTTGVTLSNNGWSLIGAYGDGGGNGYGGTQFTGTLHELLFFNRALSTLQRQQIEGYLARKWGLQSSIAAGHPYRFGLPALLPGLTPVAIPGCALWLDAADRSTLTLSGSNVTAWADKSGNGRNAGGTTSNPTYNATGFNSRPTVSFSNNVLTSSGWSLAPNRQFAWFLVVHLTSTTTSWQRFLVSASGWPDGYLGTHSNTSNILGIAGSTTVTAPIATGTLSPQLVTYLFGTSELSSNTSAVSVNSGTFSTLAGNTGGIGTNGVIIGANPGGGPEERFLGHLSEVICYNSNVTQPQRQQIEGYLAWKWGLQGTLPFSHPFRLLKP